MKKTLMTWKAGLGGFAIVVGSYGMQQLNAGNDIHDPSATLLECVQVGCNKGGVPI